MSEFFGAVYDPRAQVVTLDLFQGPSRPKHRLCEPQNGC